MSVLLADGPKILERAEHSVSRRNIDINAIKVLYRLHHAGFKSYLVGGAVRDLMLRRRPKDFDVGSDARPQQVRRLFRNSRVIGRRFRLVHIYFRDSIIEVSTFRASPDPEDQAAAPGEILITDDNVFGSPAEDASRRDFTINALFYDVGDFSVIDYVGGIDDLEHRLIRSIGDPDVRFQEDPVRMLRACELAGRLDFSIEDATRDGIRRQRREIAKAAAPRLADEIGQTLRSGSADSILICASRLGLLEVFLPEAEALLSIGERDSTGFEGIPAAMDHCTAQGRNLTDTTLFAALILPPLLVDKRKRELERGRPLSPAAFRKMAVGSMAPLAARLAQSNQKIEDTVEAISIFLRLGGPWKSAAERVRFSMRSRFDDALDLLELFVVATGEGREELELWRRVQGQRPKSRRSSGGRRPRRRRRRPR
ncbi:MAG: polynucleotide adenylyltransferase PcnB [Acidobacteriota bacterium]